MTRDRVFGYNDKEQHTPNELNLINFDTLATELQRVKIAQANGDFVPGLSFGSQIDLNAIKDQHEKPAEDFVEDTELDDNATDNLGGGEDFDALHDAFAVLLDPNSQPQDIIAAVNSLSIEDVQALSTPKMTHTLEAKMSPESFAALQDAISSAGMGDEDTSDLDTDSIGSDDSDSLEEGLDVAASDKNVKRFAKTLVDEPVLRGKGKPNEKVKQPEVNQGGDVKKVTQPKVQEGGDVKKVNQPKVQEGGDVEDVDQPKIREGGDVKEVKQPKVREASALPSYDENGVLVFTHPSQLEAGACFAASQTDPELRDRIVAARNAQRMKVVAAAFASNEPVVTASATNEIEDTTEVTEFKSPTQFNGREALAFTTICQQLGFPAGYAETQVRVAAVDDSFMKEIKNIAESNMSKNVKTAAVKECLKTAAHNEAAMKDAYDYWASFYDKDWAKALFLDDPKPVTSEKAD